MINRFYSLLVLTLTLAAEVCAAPGQPIVRSKLSARQVMVGQTVTLHVEVLVPSWFTDPIDYPTSIEIPGTTAQLSDKGANNLNERIDGLGYAGITRDYILVAREAGSFNIPALPLHVSYSVDGATQKVILKTQPQVLTATLPDGAEDLGYFFVTPTYSVKQTVDRSLDGLAQGDAITRRIIQRAEGVAAMNLPALTFSPVDGLSLYPAEARLTDSGGERGAATVGERTQEITYLMQNPGSYELPGLKVGWFNPASGKMRWSTVPSLRFKVSANPAAASLPSANAVPPAPTFREPALRLRLMQMIKDWGIVVALLGLTASLLQKRWPALKNAWRTWRQQRRDSETAAFRQCCRSLRGASPAHALNAIMRWIAHVEVPPGQAPLSYFSATYGNAVLCKSVTDLQRSMYAPHPETESWAPKLLIAALRQARGQWQLEMRPRRSRQPALAMLPPLNPL